MKKLLLTLLLFFTSHQLFSQSLPITLDGDFDDWEHASMIFETDENTEPEGVHIKRMWGANDDRFLYVKIELDREITLLENNPLVLLIDTDNDITTGYDPDNTGAELRWVFGNRQGNFYRGSDTYNVQFSHIRLRTAPTVTSTKFEFAIGRDATISGHPLFQSETITIHFQNDDDTYVTGEYNFDPEPVAPPEPIPLERFDENDLRVLAFNAWNDKLFNEQFTDQYRRILEALQPDIIAFQEIWDHNAEETKLRVETLLPSGDDYTWHAVKEDRGNVTVSRFSILDSWQILVGDQMSDQHRLTAKLIDTQQAYKTNILLVNVHLRCCSRGENNRWNEIASLADFISDAQQEGGLLHLEEDTPVILAGDFNLVGSSGQLAAIENDIPDWDGSGFKRVHARQTEKRMHYTWRNDNSGFSPGKLDYIFYSGSSLTLKNAYTLQTEEMSQEQRTIYGLHDGDTEVASDHLPHVADFEVRLTTSTDENTSIIDSYSLIQNYPNPFNPTTTISFTLPEQSNVKLELFDITGRRIAELVDTRFSAGMHDVTYDASDLSSGVYLLRMSAGVNVFTKKMTLVK